MSKEEDRDALLDALFAQCATYDTRPSIIKAGLSRFPEWDTARLFQAADALLENGDIFEVTRHALCNVNLTGKGRQRAQVRARPPAAQSINIRENYHSPVQQVATGGHGNQTTTYAIQTVDLERFVRWYRMNVNDLRLDPNQRRRADAQVATIEAQLQDEPDQTIIQKAGRSLKTIIEGALGGAAGNTISNPEVWTRLLTMFV